MTLQIIELSCSAGAFGGAFGQPHGSQQPAQGSFFGSSSDAPTGFTVNQPANSFQQAGIATPPGNTGFGLSLASNSRLCSNPDRSLDIYSRAILADCFFSLQPRSRQISDQISDGFEVPMKPFFCLLPFRMHVKPL